MDSSFEERLQQRADENNSAELERERAAETARAEVGRLSAELLDFLTSHDAPTVQVVKEVFEAPVPRGKYMFTSRRSQAVQVQKQLVAEGWVINTKRYSGDGDAYTTHHVLTTDGELMTLHQTTSISSLNRAVVGPLREITMSDYPGFRESRTAPSYQLEVLNDPQTLDCINDLLVSARDD